MAQMSRVIDEVCAEKARKLKREGYEPVLTNTCWLLLKRPENLTVKQEPRWAGVLRYNLRAVRSHLLKRQFQQFCSYRSPTSFFWRGQNGALSGPCL